MAGWPLTTGATLAGLALGAAALAGLRARAALPPGVRQDVQRTVLLAGVCAVVIAAAGPGSVPDAALGVLREGREMDVLDALGARDPWLPDAPPPTLALRERVWLHRVEAVGVVAASLIAGRLAGLGALAVVPALLLALSPLAVHAIGDGGPGVPITLLTWVAGLALARGRASTAADRTLAAVAVSSAAAAAALLRPETLVVGLVATLGAWIVLRPTWAARFDAPAPGPRWTGPLGALVLGSAVYAVLPELTAPWTHVFGRDATSPSEWTRQLASLRGLAQLLGLVPVGAAALGIAGWLRCARRSVGGAALAGATLLLVRVHAGASHGGEAPFETLRYGGIVLGLLGLYAVHGMVALSQALGGWRALGGGLALTTILLPRPTAPPELDGWAWERVETTQSVGARFLVEVHARWPTCLLLTHRAVDEGAEAGAPTWTWSPAWTGGPLGGSLGALGDDELEAKLAVAQAPRSPVDPGPWAVARSAAPCGLFVTALDCNLEGSGCGETTRGLPTLVDRRVDVPELNTHHGDHPGPLRLAVHRLWGEDGD